MSDSLESPTPWGALNQALRDHQAGKLIARNVVARLRNAAWHGRASDCEPGRRLAGYLCADIDGSLRGYVSVLCGRAEQRRRDFNEAIERVRTATRLKVGANAVDLSLVRECDDTTGNAIIAEYATALASVAPVTPADIQPIGRPSYA